MKGVSSSQEEQRQAPKIDMLPRHDVKLALIKHSAAVACNQEGKGIPRSYPLRLFIGGRPKDRRQKIQQSDKNADDAGNIPKKDGYRGKKERITNQKQIFAKEKIKQPAERERISHPA